MYKSTLTLTSPLGGGEWSTPSPGKTRYPSHRRLRGSQGWSGRVGKISPIPRFDLRTIQSVASLYTDHYPGPQNFPGWESHPGLPRGRRGYEPLYHWGLLPWDVLRGTEEKPQITVVIITLHETGSMSKVFVNVTQEWIICSTRNRPACLALFIRHWLAVLSLLRSSET